GPSCHFRRSGKSPGMAGYGAACYRAGGDLRHHIQHWSQGGATNLDNLILLCGFQHRFVHEHDWQITTSDDGTFQFRKPDWTPYPPPQPGLHPRLAALVDTRPT
ncbi:MAG: HNH endonuclease, partial [Acidimicrobiia bacterium]